MNDYVGTHNQNQGIRRLKTTWMGLLKGKPFCQRILDEQSR